jgi:hypothetical protein
LQVVLDQVVPVLADLEPGLRSFQRLQVGVMERVTPDLVASRSELLNLFPGHVRRVAEDGGVDEVGRVHAMRIENRERVDSKPHVLPCAAWVR